MVDETNTPPLIRTKLHRPPIDKNHLHRLNLLERLDRHRQRPLTLVSAPAGYGKSTLMSCWLETCDRPSAWISLDKNDNDLRIFLSYFIAAVQTIYPAFGQEIQGMLKAADLPPLPVISASLINDLDQIDQDFIFALDDYHVINEKLVHDLLNGLLHHPPRHLHLVIASRRDPPLPIATYRARGEMTEIRIQDLRFSRKETESYLEQVIGVPIEEKAAATLEKKTEGWVTGLRLAALSLRHREDLNRILAELPDDNRYIIDYLAAEVLSQQPPDIQEYMLATADLNRFCAPLCDAICKSETKTGKVGISGREFVQYLQKADLFVIPLDEEYRWFRYHHLFQELLKRRLQRRLSPEDIDSLHKRAGVWFADNGDIEEALHHFLSAGDAPSAIELVARQRHDIMNSEQWHRLERWINMLPTESIENNPDIILLRAWMCENWVRLEEMRAYLKKAEPLIAATPTKDSPHWKSLEAEMHALKAFLHYIDGDGKRAVSYSLLALEGLEPRAQRARGWAHCILAVGYQMVGELKQAYAVVHKALKEEAQRTSTYQSMIYVVLSFVHWIAADLTGLQQAAGRALKLGNDAHLPETIGIASYHLGTLHYFRNELKEAENILAAVVKEHYEPNMLNFTHSAFALTLCYLAQGRPKEAGKMVEEVIEKAMDTNSTEMLQLTEAFQAELALRQANIAQAKKWADNFDPQPFHPGYRFYVPQLTLAKVYLAQNNPKSLQQAAELLSSLRSYYSSIHNTRYLIDVLNLQALLYVVRNDKPGALTKLTESLALAEPGSFVRPFLDLGSKMAGLLEHLEEQNISTGYVAKLLVAFRNEKADTDQTAISLSSANQPLPEPLTNRELEILAFLEQRLRNKEIAEKLYISPQTVKKHTINIYQKLNAHSRQEAVANAIDFGILSPKQA